MIMQVWFMQVQMYEYDKNWDFFFFKTFLSSIHIHVLISLMLSHACLDVRHITTHTFCFEDLVFNHQAVNLLNWMKEYHSFYH